MTKTRANIQMLTDFAAMPTDIRQRELTNLKHLANTLCDTSLSVQGGIQLNFARCEVMGETYDSYSFVATRKFIKNGETYIGGANGEILNIHGMVKRCEEEVARLESQRLMGRV